MMQNRVSDAFMPLPLFGLLHFMYFDYMNTSINYHHMWFINWFPFHWFAIIGVYQSAAVCFPDFLWLYWGLADDELTRIPLQDINCMMQNRVSDAYMPMAISFPLVHCYISIYLDFDTHITHFTDLVLNLPFICLFIGRTFTWLVLFFQL